MDGSAPQAQRARSADDTDDVISVDVPAGTSGRISWNVRYSTRLGASPRDTLQRPYAGGSPSTVLPKVRYFGSSRMQTPDYSILGRLGSGGMGEVVAARQLALDRVVAIKRLSQSGVSERDQDRFRSEAILASSLDHPNIVPIYDLGVDEEGRAFFAMKKVQGRHWGARHRQLSESENLEILIRVCDAVAFAHSRGVIHRDLKPDNIMIGEFGEVLLMDWGLAIRIEDLQHEDERFASGSPAYMAPEMAGADYAAIGVRSDVYLLGACLFELLTGNAPHPGDSVQSALTNALDNVIEPTLEGGELADIALKAMAGEPAQRFADVAEFQAALRAYRGHAESNQLCAGARAALAEAGRSGRHELYARAIAGHEQALVLWADNPAAHAGLLAARRAFAEHAMSTGDIDLAASLVQSIGATDVRVGDALARNVSAARRARVQVRRRTRMLTVAAIGASVLVLILAIGAALMARHDRSEILAAIRDRDTAELRLASMEHRAWNAVMATDFEGDRMPDAVRSLQGSWTMSDRRLVASGPGTSVVQLSAQGSGPLRLAFDMLNDPGVAVHLGVDSGDLPEHPERSGITVAFAANTCQIRRGGRVLAAAPIPPPLSHLARHFVIEMHADAMRVIVDGRAIIDRQGMPGSSDLPRASLAISAQDGASLDNLRVDRPSGG